MTVCNNCGENLTNKNPFKKYCRTCCSQPKKCPDCHEYFVDLNWRKKYCSICRDKKNLPPQRYCEMCEEPLPKFSSIRLCSECRDNRKKNRNKTVRIKNSPAKKTSTADYKLCLKCDQKFKPQPARLFLCQPCFNSNAKINSI